MEYLGKDKPINKIEPLVSVCVQTYQHADYIKECLEGILMQKTDFAYEVIVGEDASSDGTREICKEYAARYPDKIRLFLRSRNDVVHINGKATGRFNLIENLNASRGEYIALCEGDDYWTDPFKLQGQVNFMSLNSQYYLIGSNAYRMDGNSTRKCMSLTQDVIAERFELVKFEPIPTATLMFRRALFDRLMASGIDVFNFVYFDLLIKSFANTLGPVFIAQSCPSVYRIHQGGVFQRNDYLTRITNGYNSFKLLKEIFSGNGRPYYYYTIARYNYRIALASRRFDSKVLHFVRAILYYLRSKFKSIFK